MTPSSEAAEAARAKSEERRTEYRERTAKALRAVVQHLGYMADALDDDDSILGVLASEGLTQDLPLLPKNVRDAFSEMLTDEAALGAKADQRYRQACR